MRPKFQKRSALKFDGRTNSAHAGINPESTAIRDNKFNETRFSGVQRTEKRWSN
jgi:hypothetical protein